MITTMTENTLQGKYDVRIIYFSMGATSLVIPVNNSRETFTNHWYLYININPKLKNKIASKSEWIRQCLLMAPYIHMKSYLWWQSFLIRFLWKSLIIVWVVLLYIFTSRNKIGILDGSFCIQPVILYYIVVVWNSLHDPSSLRYTII